MTTINRLSILFIFFGVALLSACQDGDLDNLDDQTLAAKLNITSISITPDPELGATPAYMPVNQTVQFQAIGTTPDSQNLNITNQVTWSTSDATIATISSSGLLTSITASTTTLTVTASLPTLDSVIFDLTVVDDTGLTITIQDESGTNIDPANNNDTIPLCSTAQLKVSASIPISGSSPLTWDYSDKVTWSSSDQRAKFAINQSTGLVTYTDDAVTTPITIIATYAGTPGVDSAAVIFTPDATNTVFTIDITPTTPSLDIDEQQPFTALRSNVAADDITSIINWAVVDETIVLLQDFGLVTGIKKGTTTISATCGGITSNTATIKVLDPVKLERIEIENTDADKFTTLFLTAVNGSNTKSLKATAIYSDNSIVDITDTGSWSDRDILGNNVVSVDDNNDKGLVTAINESVAEVTVSFEGLEDDIVFLVKP